MLLIPRVFAYYENEALIVIIVIMIELRKCLLCSNTSCALAFLYFFLLRERENSQVHGKERKEMELGIFDRVLLLGSSASASQLARFTVSVLMGLRLVPLVPADWAIFINSYFYQMPVR